MDIRKKLNYTFLSTIYAPIENGVTGGNSHDHNGGDGAQIAHDSLSGNGDDDHQQYVLLAGRTGGQVIHGEVEVKGSTSDSITYALKVDNSSDASLLSVRNDGRIDLPNTTYATGNNGIITKNGSHFIHNFNYGDNGTVTTAGQNTFIGENAGNLTMGSTASVTSESSYNTAIGHSSSKSLTTGYQNATFGTYSGNSITTGKNNSFFGFYSGRSTNTQSNNSFFGHLAGVYNTGSNNSYFGSSVGYNNSSGSNNSFFGYLSGRNAEGSNNAFFGTYSGTDNDGNNNTYIGYSSGRYISSGTSNVNTSNSTFLGYDTRALADGDINEIVVGYNTTGNGSNTVTLGNDSIIETHLKGVVVLGVFSSPPAGNEGGVYYNSTDKHFYGYNGTSWVQLDN